MSVTGLAHLCLAAPQIIGLRPRGEPYINCTAKVAFLGSVSVHGPWGNGMKYSPYVLEKFLSLSSLYILSCVFNLVFGFVFLLLVSLHAAS